MLELETDSEGEECNEGKSRDRVEYGIADEDTLCLAGVASKGGKGEREREEEEEKEE